MLLRAMELLKNVESGTVCHPSTADEFSAAR